MMPSRLASCLLLVTTGDAWMPSKPQLLPQRIMNRLVPPSADVAAFSCTRNAHLSGVAAPSEAAASKSVLVLGWFFAEQKQLQLVQRVYQKHGFGDVQILQSPVSLISKPRGWYKIIHKRRKHMLAHPLGRHFDVCHVMSGGFLNLYLLLAAGVPVQYDKIILDSTPILPKPRAFTSFQRAYLDSIGMDRFTKAVPFTLHLFIVSTRWMLGASYIWIKNKLCKMLRRSAAVACERDWLNWVSRLAMNNHYDRISNDALKVVFATVLKEAIFVNNPKDPFLSLEDVQGAREYCTQFDIVVRTVHVPTKHIQTIFRKPKAIFDALSAD